MNNSFLFLVANFCDNSSDYNEQRMKPIYIALHEHIHHRGMLICKASVLQCMYRNGEHLFSYRITIPFTQWIRKTELHMSIVFVSVCVYYLCIHRSTHASTYMCIHVCVVCTTCVCVCMYVLSTIVRMYECVCVRRPTTKLWNMATPLSRSN